MAPWIHLCQFDPLAVATAPERLAGDRERAFASYKVFAVGCGAVWDRTRARGTFRIARTLLYLRNHCAQHFACFLDPSLLSLWSVLHSFPEIIRILISYDIIELESWFKSYALISTVGLLLLLLCSYIVQAWALGLLVRSIYTSFSWPVLSLLVLTVLSVLVSAFYMFAVLMAPVH